jgi:hypothetical protein
VSSVDFQGRIFFYKHREIFLSVGNLTSAVCYSRQRDSKLLFSGIPGYHLSKVHLFFFISVFFVKQSFTNKLVNAQKNLINIKAFNAANNANFM